MYRVALKLFAPLAALFILFATIAPAMALEAYLFRGAGDFSFIGKGLTFSNGMDRLAEKLETAGVHSTVYRWQAVEWAYSDIMKRKPDAVMIMGHSMGALSTVALANKLKGSGVRVAYIGTIDIPGPTATAPANVEVAENFYHAFPVYGMLAKSRDFTGSLRNEYIFGQIHITMDKSQKIHASALDFVGRSRNTVQTMQAYAEPAQQNDDLLARVDTVLTGTAAAIADQPALPAGAVLVDIPLPMRAPRVIRDTQILPPIE